MDAPKILLLNPLAPFYEIELMRRPSRVWQPISLGYIASMLEGDDLAVELLDANAENLEGDALAARVEAFGPDVIVANSAQHDRWQNPIPTTQHVAEALGALGERATNAVVILVGPHGTAFPDGTLQSMPCVDFVVRNEPETTTVELVRMLVAGEDPSVLQGLSFRRDGATVNNPPAEFLADLDALPFPAYHLMPMERYRYRGRDSDPGNERERFAIMVTSRGCPYRCSYCSLEMVGKKYRTRSIGSVLEEIDLLVQRYGVNKLIFHDQVFTLRKDRVRELCEGLAARRYDLRWLCQGVVNKFPVDLLPLMRDAGCYQVSFGLESGVEEVAERMRKNSIEEFLEIRAAGERVGIDIVPNHMVGLPGETPELARKSNEFFKRFGFKYFFASATVPYPGTQLYEIGRRNGTIADETWESVVEAIGCVDNAFDARSIREIMSELYSEEDAECRPARADREAAER